MNYKETIKAYYKLTHLCTALEVEKIFLRFHASTLTKQERKWYNKIELAQTKIQQQTDALEREIGKNIIACWTPPDQDVPPIIDDFYMTAHNKSVSFSGWLRYNQGNNGLYFCLNVSIKELDSPHDNMSKAHLGLLTRSLPMFRVIQLGGHKDPAVAAMARMSIQLQGGRV